MESFTPEQIEIYVIAFNYNDISERYERITD